MEDLVYQGSESRIYLQNYLGKKMLVKERFQKHYRHPDLDNYLTKHRIKVECRNIVRCKQYGIKTPAIYFVDLNKRVIYLEYIESSITVKEYLQNLEKDGGLDTKQTKELATLIGEALAKMHLNNLVHGDLTTSNFLLTKNKKTNKNEIAVIDFGLSHSEASEEDKAVDLYVLERSLTSTHANSLEFFKDILMRYREWCGKRGIRILAKYEEVRARGRKRSMVG